MTQSMAYAKAIEIHNAALQAFTKVTADYRAGIATDVEFLAARAVMKAADEAFDSAFAIEALS